MSDEYLTTAEVARRLHVSVKTLRNKVAAGVFREGSHFFRRPGFAPRWRWDRVVEWLETPTPESPDAGILPLAEPGGRRLV